MEKWIGWQTRGWALTCIDVCHFPFGKEHGFLVTYNICIIMYEVFERCRIVFMS